MYENEIYIHTTVSARIYDAAIEANYRGRIEDPPIVEGYSVLNIDFSPYKENEVIIFDPQSGRLYHAIFYEEQNRWEYYDTQDGEYFVAWSLINDTGLYLKARQQAA